MQGATSVAVTKLDVLSYMDKIPVCTKYVIDGKETDNFPFPDALDKAQPVIKDLPGWNCDISNARMWDDLPKEAKDYVQFIEDSIGCRVEYISVGPKREEYIHRSQKD